MSECVRNHIRRNHNEIWKNVRTKIHRKSNAPIWSLDLATDIPISRNQSFMTWSIEKRNERYLNCHTRKKKIGNSRPVMTTWLEFHWKRIITCAFTSWIFGHTWWTYLYIFQFQLCNRVKRKCDTIRFICIWASSVWLWWSFVGEKKKKELRHNTNHIHMTVNNNIAHHIYSHMLGSHSFERMCQCVDWPEDDVYAVRSTHRHTFTRPCVDVFSMLMYNLFALQRFTYRRYLIGSDEY